MELMDMKVKGMLPILGCKISTERMKIIFVCKTWKWRPTWRMMSTSSMASTKSSLVSSPLVLSTHHHLSDPLDSLPTTHVQWLSSLAISQALIMQWKEIRSHAGVIDDIYDFSAAKKKKKNIHHIWLHKLPLFYFVCICHDKYHRKGRK